ncbi:hypothetical protein Tco_0613650 [Tanacetum coccineum]
MVSVVQVRSTLLWTRGTVLACNKMEDFVSIEDAIRIRPLKVMPTLDFEDWMWTSLGAVTANLMLGTSPRDLFSFSNGGNESSFVLSIQKLILKWSILWNEKKYRDSESQKVILKRKYAAVAKIREKDEEGTNSIENTSG